MTPGEIKKLIVDSLWPFFNNKKALEKNAIRFLVSDYINLNRLRNKYSGIDKDIELILSTYSDAIVKNSSFLFETIAGLIPDIIETGDRFWAFVHLERRKDKLEFHEFVKESFENIGDAIEGLMKVHIIENVAVNRIVREKAFDLAKIKSTKLGILFNELIQHSKYPHLFKTQPDNLKFSDWRNISAHKSYRVRGNEVICQYDIAPNVKSFSITRTELFDRVNQIVRTLEVLNLSHKLFGFDNIERISTKRKRDNNQQSGRDEIWLLSFITGVCSQGFEVLKLDFETEGKALMIIKDLTGQDPKRRGVHTSQFILPVWVYTRANEIIVEYRLKNGKPYLRSSSNNKVCESIYNESKTIDHLAENVYFEIIGDS